MRAENYRMAVQIQVYLRQGPQRAQVDVNVLPPHGFAELRDAVAAALQATPFRNDFNSNATAPLSPSASYGNLAL